MENSPYCVVGDITVIGDPGLTIEPGVSVVFMGNYEMRVYGVLEAIGTAQDSISFDRGGAVASWKGIVFDYSAPGSAMEFCRIENANSSGIYISESLPSIRNCLIRNCSGYNGGGVFAYVHTLVGGVLTVEGCKIDGCLAERWGGGLCANFDGTSFRLIDCEVTNNRANLDYAVEGDFGGGGTITAVVNGDILMSGCVIAGNRVYAYQYGWQNVTVYGKGGGVFSTGELTLENCIIYNNHAYASAEHNGVDWDCAELNAYARGGGVYSNSGAMELRNCIIHSNGVQAITGSCWGSRNTYLQAGGIYVNSGTVEVENCTIVENEDDGLRQGGGTLNVINSIVWENNNGGVQITGSANVTYSCVQNACDAPNNVICAHPQYDACYHIVSGSPCIDAGSPLVVYNDECFPPSLGSARNDMGVHGGPGACGWACELTGVGNLIINDGEPTTENSTVTLHNIVDGIALYCTSVEMRFSNDAVTWSSWAPFEEFCPWELPYVDGPRIVHAEYRDACQVLALTSEITVPTFLASFSIEPTTGAVEISWSVSTKADDESFRLMAIQNGNQREIAIIETEPHSYVAVDENATPDQGLEVTYILQYRAQGGTWQVLESETIKLQASPTVPTIVGIHPNPFNPQTEITYSVSRRQLVTIDVFDLSGRQVRNLLSQTVDPGTKTVPWNGRDSQGGAVASGVYFVRLKTDMGTETQKISLIR